MILAPGSLPTDDLLNQEIQALETELTGKKAVKREDLDVAGMHRLGAEEMIKLARAEGLEDQAGMPKQKLAFEILKARANKHGLMTATGTLEIMKEGFGFLRSAEYSYMDSPDDIYVSALHIRRLSLRKGQVLTGLVRAPKDTEVFFTMLHIDLVNGKPLTALRDLPTFEALTPLHPDKRIHLEMVGQPTKLETRIIDMVTPLGFGQRGLIVAPPRTGKTVILQQITNAICVNHPDVQVAEMVMEKARRMVEFGQHVVILLDSITRLARGYNNGMSGSGKIGSGGVDNAALIKPKKFFGSARNIEHGGSLTILATALVDTGSRADEVIFEEFKGTGNAELHLDRKLVEKRIYPAIDVGASGTRREELLLDPKEHELIVRLRKVVSDMNVVEAMELLKSRLGKTKSNAEFLMTMNMG